MEWLIRLGCLVVGCVIGCVLAACFRAGLYEDKEHELEITQYKVWELSWELDRMRQKRECERAKEEEK